MVVIMAVLVSVESSRSGVWGHLVRELESSLTEIRPRLKPAEGPDLSIRSGPSGIELLRYCFDALLRLIRGSRRRRWW